MIDRILKPAGIHLANEMVVYIRSILLFAVLLPVIFAGCVTNPVTGKSEFFLISESDEVALGQQQMEEWIQANEGTFPDAGLQNYVHTVGVRIAQVCHRPGLPYQFVVINSPDLNASTLPGGKTMINRGLLAKLKNEDQLAALIAHEVGHSAAMHIAAQVTQQSFTQLMLGGLQWGLAKGGVEGADYYLTGAGFASQLVLLKFDRQMEQQADNLAVDYLVRSGYNPEAVFQLMQILKKEEKEGIAISFLQSHPLTEDRIRDVAALLQAVPESIRLRSYRIAEFQDATRALTGAAEAFRWEESASAAAKRRDFSRAISDYKNAIALFPQYAPFYAHLAFVQFKAGRFAEAQSAAREAQRWGPGLFVCQSTAGIVNFGAQDYGEALRALQAADRIIPEVRTIRFYMAECYFKTADYRRAAALYGQIAQQSPGSQEGAASLQRLKQMRVIP